MPEIKVRLEAGVQTAGDGKELQEKAPSELTAGNVASVGIFANLAVSQAKRITNYAIANIGNFSGDYVLQRNIQQTMDLIGSASTIVMGAVAGGIPGLIVATVGVGINYALEAVSVATNIKKENYQAAFIRERGGDVYNDGSRGTYY